MLIISYNIIRRLTMDEELIDSIYAMQILAVTAHYTLLNLLFYYYYFFS